MQTIPNGTELGAYTIVRLIGRGGMGEVYEAQENRLQRRVALKVIAPQRAAGSHGEVDLVRRFLQEARTLAQVNHPNVVTIYSIDRIGETQFIAMEYVDGISLKDLFALFALSADEALPIFIQLAEGLRCLHDNRILHRDIKPHNLMLRPNGQVKILDFGIAKRLGDRDREATTAGIVVGTLAYLPPEVMTGQAANLRSDLWMLGAIFYECVVGQPLVTVSSRAIKGAKASADSDIIFPEECLGWIPPEMRAIIAKMSDRRPETRYASAGEVLEVLRSFQKSRPSPALATQEALHRAVENFADIKSGLDIKKLTHSKTKRALALSLLSGAPAAGQSVQIEETPPEEQIVAVEMVRDSISARRRAQRGGRSRGHGRAKTWQNLASGAVALILALAFGVRIWPGHGKESPPPAPVVQDSLRLTSPSENQVLWLEPTQLPTLSWSKAVAPGDFELQIANDANFNSIVIRENVSGNSYRPGHILNEGAYNWQLWPQRGVGRPVGPGHFTLGFLAPLETTWPKPEQVFEISHGLPSYELNLQWKCKPGAQLYRVQLGTDPEFLHSIEERTTSTCAINDMRMNPGTYYWRVRVERPEVAQALTMTRQSFTVHASGPRTPSVSPVVAAPPPGPRLKESKRTVTLHFKTGPKTRDPASLRRRVLDVPVLRWLPLRGAIRYVVQLAWNPEFSRPFSEEVVTTPSFEWTQVVPGHIYWRVKAVTEQAYGSFSAPGSLIVRLPEPQLTSEMTLDNSTPITWPAVPLADKYLVQWSRDRNLASVSESVTSEPRIQFEMTDKPVYLRVAAANSAGERVGGFSQVATVTLEGPILAAPGLITPPNGAKVAVGKSERISVVFSWSKINLADQYDVEIASTSDFAKLIGQKTLRSNQWVLKGARFNGKVYWRVRTQGPGGPSRWSAPGSFEVR